MSSVFMLTPPERMEGLRCEEANVFGIMAPGPDPKSPIPCGVPAVAIVWHQRPGERQYAMCAQCAWHNVVNRGGRLIAASDRRAVPHNLNIKGSLV